MAHPYFLLSEMSACALGFFYVHPLGGGLLG